MQAPRHVSFAGAEPLSAHLLQGCTIEYDGPAPVSEYFQPQTSDRTSGDSIRTFEAGFRGRCMRGCELNLPEGYLGFVLERRQQSIEESSTHRWHAISKFDDFSYWNHDRHPLNSDGVQRVMEWAALASVMHKPLEPEGCCEVKEEGASDGSS